MSDSMKVKEKETKRNQETKDVEDAGASLSPTTPSATTASTVTGSEDAHDQFVELLNTYCNMKTATTAAHIATALSPAALGLVGLVGGYLLGQKTSSARDEALEKMCALASDASAKVSIAGDPDLVRRIIKKLPDKERNYILDCIYSEVTNVDLMIDMIYARFGVPLGATNPNIASGDQSAVNSWMNNRTNASWGINGAKHVYYTYTLLPQADLDLIRVLITQNTNSGVCGGASSQCYYVNYKESDTNTPIGLSSKVDSTSDGRYGLIGINMTTAHELGHIVDNSHKATDSVATFSGEEKYGYSVMKSFRKISDWKSVGDADVVEKMKTEYMSASPFSSNKAFTKTSLTKDEVINAATAIGKEIINCDKTGADSNNGGSVQSWAKAGTFINNEINNNASTSSLDDTKRTELGKVLTELEDSNLLYQLWMSLAHQNACMNQYSGHSGCRAGLKAPFHQSYTWKKCWYSFDKSNWSNKISCYQYRDPGEEFAETYASFFVSKGNLSEAELKKDPHQWSVSTPQKLKDWFVDNGLHNMDKASELGG